MKYLKSKINFEKVNEGLKTRVNNICNKYNIKNWSINSEGLVDVDGTVVFRYMKLDKIPIKFGKVTGSFYCQGNNLTSLEGCPTYVGGSFFCGDNKLNSLEFCPKYVGDGFSCPNNNIKTFDGIFKINGTFYPSGNPIESIWDIIILPDFSIDYDKWDNQIMDLFFDYDPIREDGILLDRFNEFLQEIGLDPVDSVKGYKNI